MSRFPNRTRLVCYSPGASPLCFHFEDKDRNVLSSKTHPVYPSRIARYLKSKEGEHFAKKGYKIHKIEGRYTIMKEVRRVDHETLEMIDDEGEKWERFRYRVIHPVPADREIWSNSLRIEFWRDTDDIAPNCDGWWKLRNWSMINQITFFIRYEPIWERSKWNGKPVKDEDSWGYCREFATTEFADGDGRQFTD